MSSPRLYIGLDIGGTKARAAYRRSDDASGHEGFVASEGANLKSAGASRLAGIIKATVDRVRAESGVSFPAAVVAGVAGAGRPEDRRALADCFRESVGTTGVSLSVVSDAEIALEGAFSGGSGAIVIAGTGSGAFARERTGTSLRSGGWGVVIGDPGSATSIAVAALRETAFALDRVRHGDLTALLAERFGITDAASLVRVAYDPSFDRGSIAREVVQSARSGRPEAMALVNSEIERLADDAVVVMRESVEPVFVLMGGMCENVWFAHRLEEAVLEARPAWRRVAAAASPQSGALRMAERRDAS